MDRLGVSMAAQFLDAPIVGRNEILIAICPNEQFHAVDQEPDRKDIVTQVRQRNANSVDLLLSEEDSVSALNASSSHVITVNAFVKSRRIDSMSFSLA